MKCYQIIIGREKGKRKQRYMKVVDQDSVFFRKFREKTYTWGAKYGVYNTIKQKAGSATFYEIGRVDLELDVLETLDIPVDLNNVSIGWNIP